MRNLELIGEAATHIPDEVRAAHPEIPWRLIVATRNRLIHAINHCLPATESNFRLSCSNTVISSAGIGGLK